MVPERDMLAVLDAIRRANIEMVSGLPQRLSERLATGDAQISPVRISERR